MAHSEPPAKKKLRLTRHSGLLAAFRAARRRILNRWQRKNSG